MLNPARNLPAEPEHPTFPRLAARFCLLPALAWCGTLAWIAITAFRGLSVTVPDLSGARLGEAIELLHRRGLVPVPAEAAAPLHPDLTVADTEPAAGTRLRRGSSVAVRPSQSPEEFRVPGLIGLSRQEALERLRGTRFSLGSERALYAGAPPGVIAQNPRPGSLSSGGLIDVLHSLGPEPRTYVTPRLVGATLGAVLEVYGRGLQLIAEIRYRAPRSDEAEAQIVEQHPPPGDPLGGDGLKLVVAAGPATQRFRILELTVPDGPAEPQEILMLTDGLEAERLDAMPGARLRVPVPVGPGGAAVQIEVRVSGGLLQQRRLGALAERSKPQ
jgi:beta-lactam-binding protein with PASTA domain